MNVPERQPAGGGLSLNRVLMAAIGGVALGAVIVTAGLTLGLLRLTAERATISDLRVEAERIQDLTRELQERPRGFIPRLIQARPGPDVHILPQGVALPEGFEQPEGRATVDGSEVIYVTAPLDVGGRPATLVVVREAGRMQTLSGAIAGRILVAGLVALIASSAVAYGLANRITRPLGQLAGAARGLARGEPARIAPEGFEPDEVAGLRRAFADLSDDLQAARERERAFLLSVSHELKTPLTAIRGYGEALHDGTAPAAGKAGSVIVSESRRLERLVQDLIDLARLQTGEFSVELEEVDLSKLAIDAVESFRPRATEAGVGLEVQTTDDPALVQTDPDRVHQMLANLLENALRVTPRDGRVRATVNAMAIDITDSGPGLDPEDLDRTFERFYLWRKYRGERPVGSGLGLAIVGELARLLEVDVQVRSAPRAGTTFRLSFADQDDG